MRNLPSERLNKKVVTSWRIGNVISSLLIAICLIGTAVIVYFASNGIIGMFWVWLAIAISAVWFIATVAVTPSINYVRWRYAVSDDEVDIMRGLIVRKRSIIPLVRVQHVDTKQGPILRALGLASVTVATAAGEHEIPGLQLEQADALRDRVATLARMAQEDV